MDTHRVLHTGVSGKDQASDMDNQIPWEGGLRSRTPNSRFQPFRRPLARNSHPSGPLTPLPISARLYSIKGNCPMPLQLSSNEHLDYIAALLDDIFRIPGTQIRFGL